MGATTGRDALLDVLASEGVRHLFGNPGTTELPLIDALAERSEFAYVLALQEATAVGMADGYAQVTGRPAFLNLHTSAGLGNAIGNLTNAVANRTPLVVTAGQQDTRHLVADPLLSGDLVGLARPVSKWTHELRRSEDVGVIVRRAFRDAATAPAGPVFVSLPMDLLDATVDNGIDVPPKTRLAGTSPGDLANLAELLVETDPARLAIVAGDEVGTAEAPGHLAHLAEALGCTVLGGPLTGRHVFDPRHPLWGGPLPPAAAGIRARLDGFDRVLLIGGQAFLVYPYTEGSPLPRHTELLHMSPSAVDIGRAHPTRYGFAGDISTALTFLPDVVRVRIERSGVPDDDPRSPESRRARVARSAAAREASIAAGEERARATYGPAPLAPAAAAHALLRALPPGTPVVDEAVTTGSLVRSLHLDGGPGGYFFCRGGGLGWGMPAALGVSLGRDRAPVLCIVGDGSAMYSPQALWTAAREQLPVVFAVVDNGQYLILKNALRSRGGPAASTGDFVAMDLDTPRVDHLALARSMGVDATRVDHAADVSAAVEAALASGRPHVVHVPIAAP